MKKEYTWEISLEGATHLVTCVPRGNKYELWVDDEDLTVVYRPGVRKMNHGLEQALSVGGKSCLFVVWDERPDLVVDDMMQESGKSYSKEKGKRKKGMITAYTIMFCAGIALFGLIIASLFVDALKEKWEWIDYAVYILAAMLLIYDGGMEMKYWKNQ